MPPSPRRVVVDGGANTALDMARAARRLGDEVVIVYRRTREKMPEHDFEVQEALEEGVTINWLRTITHMNEGSLVVEKMELDADGYSQPTGEVEAIAGNTLVLALGQNVDMRVLERIPSVTMTKDGVVAVGPNMMTGAEQANNAAHDEVRDQARDEAHDEANDEANDRPVWKRAWSPGTAIGTDQKTCWTWSWGSTSCAGI